VRGLRRLLGLGMVAGATACGIPTDPGIEQRSLCAFGAALYTEALARDGWEVDDPSPILNRAFSDPAIGEALLYAPIADIRGIHFTNASIFTLQEGFENAYACITVIGVEDLPGAVERSQIRVSYRYQGRERQAYVYGDLPSVCGGGSSSVLVIPGSGHNQSSAIVSRAPENYHFGVFDAFSAIDRHYVFIKPNEDVLAWHDGNGQKLSGTFIWNWHLNRQGSYSVAYLVQALAVQKWLDGCFSRRILAGLSQGGAAALLLGLQSHASEVVVAAGHSLLFHETEWSGHNQLIGVPGLARLYRAGPLVEALDRSSSRWLFTYGATDGDIYRIEADTGLTASYIGHLPNVEVVTHRGGHEFPVNEIRAFLAETTQ
jgi:predicted esterase